eukprot:XP_014774633.1 PREDICTED: zinc finger protein 32-like [Octopus bimaculoides]
MNYVSSRLNVINDEIVKEIRKTSHHCDICKKSFAKKGNLNTHKRIHTASNLTIHKYIHTGEKPHQCDNCEKTFSATSNLTMHRHIHTGGKPYHCDMCDISFSHGSALTIHHRYVHKGKKPYFCEICGKSFFARREDGIPNFMASLQMFGPRLYGQCANDWTLSL